VNLRHQFFAAQAVVGDMVQLGAGSIINLGSISWMIKGAGYPAYATTKAAIHGLTRSLAKDLGKRNIRVNTLVPGWVMTDKQLRLWVTPESEKAIDDNQCLPGRLMSDDIAQMALFLAADDSRMCTASDFVVDAGWS
jgi:D-xylose 1-dehydrogenase